MCRYYLRTSVIGAGTVFSNKDITSPSNILDSYQVMLRQVVITYRGTKLIGPWSKPAQTSFLCKNNLRGK